MEELELFSDLQLQERIADCDYLLRYGCTEDTAKHLAYEQQACQEILRRRNYDPRQEDAPEWFNNLNF